MIIQKKAPERFQRKDGFGRPVVRKIPEGLTAADIQKEAAVHVLSYGGESGLAALPCGNGSGFATKTVQVAPVGTTTS